MVGPSDFHVADQSNDRTGHVAQNGRPEIRDRFRRPKHDLNRRMFANRHIRLWAGRWQFVFPAENLNQRVNGDQIRRC